MTSNYTFHNISLVHPLSPCSVPTIDISPPTIIHHSTLPSELPTVHDNTTDTYVTHNRISTDFVSKNYTNGYISYIKETGEELFKYIIHITEEVTIIHTNIPTERPLTSVLILSRETINNNCCVTSITATTKHFTNKILMSIIILSHKTIVFESFHTVLVIFIDPSESFSD